MQNIIWKEERNMQKQKKGIKERKENFLRSLKEVEIFLENWKKISKGIKIYKILK